MTTPVRSRCAICSALVRSPLVSAHLSGLAHPKGRQRIDHVIPKCVLLKEGTDRLPHVPGRLEREVHLSSSPADTRRGAALHKLVETLAGM